MTVYRWRPPPRRWFDGSKEKGPSVSGASLSSPRPPPVSASPRGGGDGRGEGANSSRSRRRRHRLNHRLPYWSPRDDLGTGTSKNNHASISEPISGRHERREVRAPGVAFAGERPAPTGERAAK